MTRIIGQLRDIAHQLERVCEQIAKEHGIEQLAGPQGHVLVFLEQQAHQEVFVKDIEKRLQISKSVSSSLVKRMARNGFIEVLPDQTDKRYKQVVLTEKGRACLPQLQACRKAIEDCFFQKISKEDFATVEKVINQLKQNVLEGEKNKDA
ncbi:MarR family winged helix-turn-helix transcriptional regulator [Streptococcus halichoeri]|uniref:MarR family winged helix-turn-helix transcriptional regulator n=1 Tax=Streptococcus halichoeri TaxID=254785 RepID=UPI001C8E0E70|nr:MarR family transcriptional regulator [Streptococcus halichoeri]